MLRLGLTGPVLSFFQFYCKMLLTVRDTVGSIPAADVPIWVAEDDVTIKINVFLASLVVYDAGARLFHLSFISDLSLASK